MDEERRILTSRAAAVLILIALVAAGCQSSTSGAPPRPPTPPGPASNETPEGGGATECTTLASAAEVSGIVGEEVSEPSSASTTFGGIPGANATACRYEAPDGTVGFSFGTGPDPGIVRDVFEQSKQSQEGEDVAGLGDAAYFSASDDNLLVIRGRTFLSVGVVLASVAGAADERSVDVALAQMVLARI